MCRIWMSPILCLLIGWMAAQVRGDSCDDASQAQPLYRDYSVSLGDHFYTTDEGEYDDANKAGYIPEGIAARVFTTKVTDAVQFFRLYSTAAGDHLYTTDTSEVASATSTQYNYTLQSGPPMYIYQSALCGSVPLYRLHSGDVRDHFYTTNATERDSAEKNGFAFEKIAGYVIDAGGGTSLTAVPLSSTGSASASTSASESASTEVAPTKANGAAVQRVGASALLVMIAALLPQL
ncbi:hypothetical protein C8R47DRAFT_1313671 [Mycena vitilis]|nr:hypothetical protein C8R47DRAFT_1313671 [Mycena vitilis]